MLAAPPALATPPATPEGAGPVHDPADLKPEAPMPADALIPGAAGVDLILCPADPPPMDATGALGGAVPSPSAPRVVRVDHPWDAEPLMTGAGPQIPVRFFKRGRTLIFDAGAEVIYIERDHRSFTYTATNKAGVTKWRGTCRVEG